MCFRSCPPEKWAADIRYLLWLRAYMQAGAPLGPSERASELWAAYRTDTRRN